MDGVGVVRLEGIEMVVNVDFVVVLAVGVIDDACTNRTVHLLVNFEEFEIASVVRVSSGVVVFAVALWVVGGFSLEAVENLVDTAVLLVASLRFVTNLGGFLEQMLSCGVRVRVGFPGLNFNLDFLFSSFNFAVALESNLLSRIEAEGI